MSASTRRRGLLVGVVLLGAAAVGIVGAAFWPVGGHDAAGGPVPTEAVATDTPA